jgi:hypothetical protein
MNYKKGDIINYYEFSEKEENDKRKGLIIRSYPSRKEYEIQRIDIYPDDKDNYDHYYLSDCKWRYDENQIIGLSIIQIERKPKN